MKVIALHPFVHDRLAPNPGDELELNESLANELEKRGLVKMAQKPENKMAQPKNKSKAK